MRKLKLYIAMSLNGKIARLDGDLEWLESIPDPHDADYGYSEFYQSVDTTIQGYNTYKLILDRGFENPYKDTTNYVFTRKQDIIETDGISFVKEDHVDFVRNLKQQPGKDIWLIGGGQINTLMFNEGLIDELFVFVMPVIIPDGIELFGGAPIEKRLNLVSTKAYSNGVVEIIYQF